MASKGKRKPRERKKKGRSFLVQCTICSALESVRLEQLDPYSFPICDDDGAIMVLVGLQNESW